MGRIKGAKNKIKEEEKKVVKDEGFRRSELREDKSIIPETNKPGPEIPELKSKNVISKSGGMYFPEV